MNAILAWLAELESMARDLYEKGAAYFGSNQKLSSLLGKLALDETYHYNTVLRMQNIIDSEGSDFMPAIQLEEAKVDLYKNLIIETIRKLNEKTLTESDIYRCILSVEFSEWNDYFVFAVNSVFAGSEDAHPVASKCQRHVTRLEYYFHSEQSLMELYDQLVKIPRLWNYRILVVDDDQPIRDVIAAVLQKYYLVDTASNGVSALQKVREFYYDVVVSDISMPEMDGIQLYKALSEIEDFDRRTVILMSGNADPTNSLFTDLGTPLIEKPFVLDRLLRTIEQVIRNE
jgi:CheY-like chemotaxis protein